MWKLSIDIAERNGSDLRRRLASAECLRDSAISRALRFVNTPGSRSSASLVCITRCDQREPPLLVCARARLMPVWPRPARLPYECAHVLRERLGFRPREVAHVLVRSDAPGATSLGPSSLSDLTTSDGR